MYEAVSNPALLDTPELLPQELCLVLRRHPNLLPQLQDVLKRGVIIGVRSAGKSSSTILEAVRTVSVHTQHRLISPWLRPLLLHNIAPVFTEQDYAMAKAHGEDLDAHIDSLRASRAELKVFVFIQQRKHVPTPDDVRLIEQLNVALMPAALEYAVNRIEFDNANERTEVAQAILKAMLLIGPVAHVFEQITHGVGKIIAASTDDLLSEVAELSALHGSGFTWKQLLGRSKILIPVFLLATYGAYSVEDFILRGEFVLGGLIFGLSAVALSLTTGIQSVKMYKQCVDDAVHDGKLNVPAGFERWRVAVQQDFSNPARLGLLIGAGMSPLIAIAVFVLLPQLTHNGWVLALLGTTETVVAGGTVMFARSINNRRYARRIFRDA